VTHDTDFFIKVGDTAPPLECELTDADGDPVNLTGAVVRFHMAPRGAIAVINRLADIITPLAGLVRYSWQVGDTALAGFFIGEFEVTFATGAKETFPNDGDIVIRIGSAIA
jgi:hypothetical protein